MVIYYNELESRILKWREGEGGLGEARLFGLKKLGDFLDEPPPWAASFQVQRPRGAWMYPDSQGDGELGRERHEETWVV